MLAYVLGALMICAPFIYGQVPEVFTTQRLYAERVTEKHINYILEIISNEQVQQTYGFPSIATLADAFSQLSIAHNQWEQYGYGLYAIFDKESSAFIGLGGYHSVIKDEFNEINCFSIDKPADLLELYGLLMPSYWRHGYGFEMGAKLIDIAFSNLPNSCIIAYAKAENHAAVQLMKKLGFTQTGIVTYKDEPHLLYSLSKKA